MKRGKKYQEALKQIDRSKYYSLNEGLDLVKKTSKTKFDGTVELAIKLNVNPKKADQNLRGAIVLPYGTGKTYRVLVFAEGEDAKKAKQAGADYVGDTDLVKKIEGGWLDFDQVVATPNMMPKIGKLGRVLGPRGLMPNPKTGTVTQDVTKAVKEIKAGKIEYRVDTFGNIHAPVGKVSFDKKKLAANIKTLVNQMDKEKPSTVKGVYMKNVSISSTMGPGIKLDINTIKSEKE